MRIYMRCQQNVRETWVCYLTLCQSGTKFLFIASCFFLSITSQANCFRTIFADQVFCISFYESYCPRGDRGKSL